ARPSWASRAGIGRLLAKAWSARQRCGPCSRGSLRRGIKEVRPRATRGLLSGRIRVMMPRLVFTAEGQPEFAGDLGPEFAQHVETHVCDDAVAHQLRCRREEIGRAHV